MAGGADSRRQSHKKRKSVGTPKKPRSAEQTDTILEEPEEDRSSGGRSSGGRSRDGDDGGSSPVLIQVDGGQSPDGATSASPGGGKRGRARQDGKRKVFIDQAPKHRTAMGNYIVPVGGRPLTRLEAYPAAGPADHIMPNSNLWKPKAPEWSIPIRCFYQWKGSGAPASNHYMLPDIVAMNRKVRFTFGKRFRPNRKLIAGPCKKGPTYMVKGHVTGTVGPYWSIPKAARDKVVIGPPNSLVTPQDMPGFKSAPAEEYEDRLCRPRAPEPIILGKYKELTPDKKPGPAKYQLPEIPPGRESSFGLALKQIHGDASIPGPNAYYPKAPIGEGPKFSIISRKVPKEHRRAPSPFAYMREREYTHKEKVHMGFVLPELTPTKVPPCTAYTIRKDDFGTAVTMKGRTKVPYPCSQWGFDGEVGRSPGPAAHNIRRDPRKKTITIKRRFKPPLADQKPGPADHGRIEPDPLSTVTNPPAFSMRPIWETLKSTPNPGPAAYTAPPLDGGPAWTMRMKTKGVGGKLRVPAPNAYKPKQGCTRFGLQTVGIGGGISMSSRHTPWKSSGPAIHPNSGLKLDPWGGMKPGP